MDKVLNIVLYEPLIPENVGNIMRTCVALNAHLHIIEPVGFNLDDARMKRAALDYRQFSQITYYLDFNNFMERNLPEQIYFLSRYAKKCYSDIQFSKNKPVYLMFGKETTGIDKAILKANLDKCFRIPMSKNVRSLNLANTVAIVGYFWAEKLNFPEMEKLEPECFKGSDFLEK